MLEVKDLQVAYGKIQAVKGISFTVDAGPGRDADRHQRRRQDDHAAHDLRAAPARVGGDLVRGRSGSTGRRPTRS